MRGPFGQLLTSLCDCGDMTPHTLVGGDQTTLTARASARADRRDCPSDVSEAWGPRGNIHIHPGPGLDAGRFGPAPLAHRGRRYGPEVALLRTVGKGSIQRNVVPKHKSGTQSLLSRPEGV